MDGAAQPNQILDAQIKASIDSQLATKGLTKTDSEKADLFIGYQVSIDQERQWNAYGMGGGMATATSTAINESDRMDRPSNYSISAPISKRIRRTSTRLWRSC